MDRRDFIKSVPAIASGLAAMTVTVQVKRQPSSIMLIFSHRDNPNRHGVWTWNTETQSAYERFHLEAMATELMYVSRGYDTEYREFNVLKFV